MPLPGMTNRSLTNAQNVIKPSNFRSSPLPAASTRYDPAPAPDPIKLSLENSLKQYQPAPAPSTKKYASILPKPILPKVSNAIPQPKTQNSIPLPHQFNPADYGGSNPSKMPASVEPISPVQTQLSNSGQQVLDSLNRAGIPIGSSGSRMAGEEGAIVNAADLLLRKAIESGGYTIDPTTPEQRARNGQILRGLAKDIGNGLNDLGNALKNPQNTFNNLFDKLADPFRNHPRTDPKNDDSRPKRQRYAYEIRAFTFYSPNNHDYVEATSAGGEYSLGEIGYNNPNFTYSPGNTAKLHQAIYWDAVGGNAPNFTTSSASAQCEPDTIQPDPTYIPPSRDLPYLIDPGTIPDPGYPPIFTEDDFKPQKQQNNDQAKQDEQQRQAAPDPEQQRQKANQADRTIDPTPWDTPIVTPSPYPYPLDAPGETTAPDATPTDRERDSSQRLKDAIEQISPSPQNQEPRTEVTINGEPVTTRTPFPPPVRSPVTATTADPGTSVTINGEPDPRLNPPLPDTRVNSPTTILPPVLPIIDPITGISPPTPPTVTDTPTPDRCEDPCIQGLHDKQDAATATASLTIKIFKSCSKPSPIGQLLTLTDEIDFDQKTIQVPKSEMDAYQILYDRIFALESLQCKECTAIAAVPEWWQVRLEGQRPQLVLQFAELRDDGSKGSPKYAFTIPHYIGNKEPEISPVSSYQKGSTEGILTLKDNSKVIVNAISKDACLRVIAESKLVIDPVMLEGSFIKVGDRRGQALSEINVVPRMCKYFSTGLKNTTPEWSAIFT